eukprot:scaffold312327_cov32-Tisochrysis_lutea.AAC.1
MPQCISRARFQVGLTLTVEHRARTLSHSLTAKFYNGHQGRGRRAAAGAALAMAEAASQGVLEQIPVATFIEDIDKFMAELGEALTAHYELAQCVYAKATVPVHQENKVCLWLGANVMLEYPREEVRQSL